MLLRLPILSYLVLMRGGNELSLLERWPKVAERELDIDRRVQYRDAALVFAELTRRQPDWLQVLGGWQVRESEYIKGWEKVGEDRRNLQAKRADLLEAVQLRLEDPVPESIRRTID